jgi:hypothetical protein
MTQRLTRTHPTIQNIAGNEHHLAAAHTPYLLYKDRTNYTKHSEQLHTGSKEKPIHQHTVTL